MHGAVALVGGGEFQPSMEAFDRDLVEATGSSRPRIAVLLAAQRRNTEPAAHRGLLARAHFEGLGGEVEEIVLRNRADADDESTAQAIGEADLVYLADAAADPLRRALEGSAGWAAIERACERGAVLVGAGGGACVLGDRQLRIAPRKGWPIHWRPALAVCRAAVLPRYDRMPEAVAAFLVLHAPRGLTVVGIEDGTGVVGRDGAWQVHGSGCVTVWRGRRRERLSDGDVFRL